MSNNLYKVGQASSKSITVSFGVRLGKQNNSYLKYDSTHAIKYYVSQTTAIIKGSPKYNNVSYWNNVLSAGHTIYVTVKIHDIPPDSAGISSGGKCHLMKY